MLDSTKPKFIGIPLKYENTIQLFFVSYVEKYSTTLPQLSNFQILNILEKSELWYTQALYVFNSCSFPFFP